MYEKSYGLVCGYARKLAVVGILTRQDVEDVVSRDLVVAFAKESKFSSKSLFSTRLCGIARYKVYEMCRQKMVLQKRECEWNDA